MRRRLVCLAVAAATSAVGLALTPGVYALPVPLAECLGCPWPPGDHPLPRGCFYRAQWCDRIDSAPYQINAGTPGTVMGGRHTCRNCRNCPNCPPPPMVCVQALQVCFQESVSFQIAPGISGGDRIKAELKAAIGIQSTQQVCATINCGSNAVAPCTWVGYAAVMHVLNGVSYGIDHTYSRSGIIDNHFGQTCPAPYHGLIWSQPTCSTKTSTATGNKAVDSGCETTGSGNC